MKEFIKELYPLEDYKKLKTEKPAYFWITIIIPLSFLLAFFLLYFYPFGYNYLYYFTQEDLFEEKKGVTLHLGKDSYNGMLQIEITPKPRVRNLSGVLEVKGDNVYILQNKISSKDILDIWEYEVDNFYIENMHEENLNSERALMFDTFSYSIIDDYPILDSNTIAFHLTWTSCSNETNYEPNQLLLKYKNLKIVQHLEYVEFRIDEIYKDNIYTYQLTNHINNCAENELIAVYTKPDDHLNGFIELIVNGSRVGRVVVASPYNLIQNYQEESFPVNEHLVKDLNQESISLGQELYRVEIDEKLSKDIAETIDINQYYQNKYKRPLLEEKHASYRPTLSEYYEKPFYNYFKGSINQLKIGYEYPLKKEQKYTDFYGNTPFVISIAGNTEDIEEISFKTFKEPIWKNF